jgi:RNA polymerase sigma-32 factor
MDREEGKVLEGKGAYGRLPRPYDPLQRYLFEINQIPLLSPEEEKELAVAYQEKGDRDAAMRLVTANLRLVVKIALEFERYWMKNLMDLIQEGNLGLMQAVKKFDPYRGIKLSYYSSFWIKAQILKFIMDNWKLVKIGTTQAQRKLFYNLKKEKERLFSLGYDPEPRLLSERLQVKESEVIEMDQRLGSWEVPLDAPAREGSQEMQANVIPSTEETVEEAVVRSEIENLVKKKLAAFGAQLKGKEKVIYEKRLLAENPMTLQEIGDTFHITRERVRQIQANIFKKLKAYLEKEIPDFDEEYLSILGI